MTPVLKQLCAITGIVPWFLDLSGAPQETPPETARALLAAMGLDALDDAAATRTLERLQAENAARRLPRWLVLTADAPGTLPLADDAPAHWELTLEDGEVLEGQGAALPSLPLGRHCLRIEGQVCWLLSAPDRLPAPDDGWGITLPLYGLRPAGTGGIGDYGDLAQAMSAFGGLGAGFVGINPIHAGFPTDPQAFSPYAPSHRRRLNVLHLSCPEDVTGQGSELIDYPAGTAQRMAAQRAAFTAFEAAGGDAEFDGYLDREGIKLRRFALHQALSDAHGPYWNEWPEALQSPESPAAQDFAQAHPAELRFHGWLQWRAEAELATVGRAADAAGMAQGLYLDLAVGTHPHGAETWARPDQFARDASLGAPPDAFAPQGQVWGLAAFNPLALADQGFEPLADTLARQLRFSRLLRIDHVLGFERTFWVPTNADLPGGYVTMPREAMLAVVRIEAARAGATIIGEDLGNIPDGLQDAMAASGLLGCRVAQFEQDYQGGTGYRRPESYSREALAAFGTHDLPTWRGWRAERDIAARADLALVDTVSAERARTERRRDVAGFDAVAGTGDTDGSGATGDAGGQMRLNAFLAQVNSRLVALQVEDLLEIEDQPNLPGTVHQYPNWRRRLPLSPAEMADDHRVRAAAQIMHAHGRKEDKWIA